MIYVLLQRENVLNLICSRRLWLPRCCRLFRMRKLVMGFVVMSQVLLILEHLVAVFALKCVIVLKGCLNTNR